MAELYTYIPQDRLRALARGTSPPDRTSGSALFADISGFTPLTESLQKEYGPRRGSEVLSWQLQVVYSALIAEIECYGGSVISFAGDSVLCWFDRSAAGSHPPEARALNAALGMQAAMRSFAVIQVGEKSVALSLKVSIATGPARRF